MLRSCVHQFIWLIFCVFWTSSKVSGQALNNYQDSETNIESSGSWQFFYQQPHYPRDCYEARNQCSASNLSGIHLIKPDGYPEPFEVYCDNTIDSGGWTVIHRLKDGSINFNRNWTDYKIGFGFLLQEFWLGNEKLSFLTNQNSYKLRIDIISADGLPFSVTYDRFRISDEYSEYKLTGVGEYNGTEDEITMFLCPPNKEAVVSLSSDCSTRCSCTGGQFVCDNTYPCDPNALCQERDNVSKCICKPGYAGDGINCSPIVDCQDVYNRVSTESGVYTIKPTTWQGESFNVYCNMTDGGGWTVFQRRVDGTQNFFLDWSDYKDGFGTPEHESWLGNEKLHSLTKQMNYELRIDFVNNIGDPYFAKYNSFKINNEGDNYRLILGSYSGNAGDRLSENNGHAFTTPDRDNDAYSIENCATHTSVHWCSRCTYNAGWWYSYCGLSLLNSPYGSDCFAWDNIPGSRCSLKYTEMKVRPV